MVFPITVLLKYELILFVVLYVLLLISITSPFSGKGFNGEWEWASSAPYIHLHPCCCSCYVCCGHNGSWKSQSMHKDLILMQNHKKNFIIFLLLFCLDLCNLFRWENGRLGRRRHRLFSTKWPMVCWLILKCSQLNSVYMRRKRDFNLHVLQIQKGLDSSEKHHLQEDI